MRILALALSTAALAAAQIDVVASVDKIRLNEPFGIDFDRSGNAYIVEHKGQRIVRMTPDGKFATFAGTGAVGKSGDNGPASKATFFDPHGIAITRDGLWMYVADTRNHLVRRIDMRKQTIITVAGTGEEGFSGDGGKAAAATFRGTFGIALSPDDRFLYVADLGNRRVRRLDLKQGTISTVAGNGEKGVPADGSIAKDSPLVDPRAVAVDSRNQVYILERGGNALRVAGTDGRIRTVIAPGQIQPDMKGPKHLTIDRQDRVVIADAENHLIRRYDPRTGRTETLMGTGVKGTVVVAADPLQTEVNRPHGVTVDRTGLLYVIDSYNHRVLRMREGGSANWPMFRGVQAFGVGAGSVQSSWNADKDAGPDRNVLWKAPVDGLSHSSPVIWGERIYVATAISSAGPAPLKVGLYGAGDPAADDAEQQWVVYCLNKRTGKVEWRKVAHQGKPRGRRHTKATHANTTLATDGTRLVAFLGSEGVHVFDMNGNPLWKKDLGAFDIGPQGYDLQWGSASSPVIHGETLLLQCDQKKGSFLVAFRLSDGHELWRTGRDGVSNHSWATPMVVTAGGRTQVVCNGWPYITGYDLASGKELWRLKSGGDIPVPTPIYAQGLIYVTNAHGGPAPLYAIKPTATGDISLAGENRANDGIAWSEPRNGAYMQTPLIVDGILYSCSDRGVLKAYNAATGELYYTQRLGTGTVGFSSSPVYADGKLFFASEEGEVFVIKAGRVFELLGTNKLGEIAMASPAVSEGVLFYRTRGHLVAIGKR